MAEGVMTNVLTISPGSSPTDDVVTEMLDETVANAGGRRVSEWRFLKIGERTYEFACMAEKG